MLAKQVEAGSCPKLENKIFDNLVDMMVAIKSGSQTSGNGNEKDRPAFTATLQSHLTLSKDNTIKYDRVILNQGRGYSPKTGIFTATKSGLYLISATVMSNGGIALGAYISKNGANLMNLKKEKDRPAFTATLARTLTLMKGITIKYDTVILNQGRGYSPKTGIFTATKTGLYLISATVMSKGGAYLDAYISKNGANLMNLYGPQIHGGTKTANPVLHLEKGDKVSVRSGGSFGVYGGTYSYFSAVYIA
ncbi:unnamed protein product [Mytilus edulis]|uniref:C1q domain-containing protein n=1 Tax=Mytilus edulis TaxID=6550 RepID=A0A8S3V3B2_MYTED|nr:unnamed protein product [Mytilus edulis]